MWQLRHDRLRIWPLMDVNIISFKRFDEGFGHSVAFRARHRSCTADQAQLAGKIPRLFGGITRAVVGQPLDSVRSTIHTAKTVLETLDHKIANHCAADATSGGHKADHLAVAAIQAEGHTDDLAVGAGNFKYIRTPAHVAAKRNDHAIVSSHWALAGISAQQHIVLLHDPINTLVVNSGFAQCL